MGDDLTKESFNKLLNFLAPDREAAAREYETLRRKLIFFFSARRSRFPEDLADKTISTIARRLQEDIDIHDVSRYALGVAHNVFLNSLRQEHFLERLEEVDLDRYTAVYPTDYPEQTVELYSECLDSCLKQLNSADRNLFLKYYKERKYSSRYRARLADQLGITRNALTIKVLYIRRTLEKCIIKCAEKNESS